MTDYTIAKYLSKYCFREIVNKCLFTYSQPSFLPAKSHFRPKKPKQKTITAKTWKYIKGGFTITNKITNKYSEYSVS